MRLTTGKDPCSVLNELRNTLLPGKKHTRIRPFFALRYDKEEARLNEDNILIGEVKGNRFWMMHTCRSSFCDCFSLQHYFSGRVIKRKDKTIICGRFVPQPATQRYAVAYWGILMLFVSAIGVIFRDFSILDLLIFTFLCIVSHPILCFIKRIYSRSEERKVRDVLRRIASEEGEGSCAS